MKITALALALITIINGGVNTAGIKEASRIVVSNGQVELK